MAALGTAYAGTTYDFTLTTTNGPVFNGSGTIPLGETIPDGSFSAGQTGTDTAFAAQIVGLTISIDGLTYNLAQGTGANAAFHFNGTTEVLDNLSDSWNGFPQFNMGGSTYNFQSTAQSQTTNGKITFDFTPVPEPSSALLIAGLPSLRRVAHAQGFGESLKQVPAAKAKIE